MSERRACQGADTITVPMCGTEFAECVECERRIRWDLTENGFFGWQTCEQAPKTAGPDAVDQLIQDLSTRSQS